MALFIDGKQARGSLVVEGDLTMPLPTYKTSSGSVATFNTDLTENLVEVKCQIVAQQASGTPSPVNPLPITTYNSLMLGQDANYNKFLDFNQLIQNGNFTSTSNWSAVRGSISANNNECAYTLSELTTVSTGNRIQQVVSQINSHKYIAMAKVKVPHASTIGIECYNAGLVTSINVSDIDTYVDCDVLFSANAISSAYFYWGVSNSTGAGYVIGDTVYFKDVQLIDLTQCFGETLADYIYSLGQTDGIAYVRNLLPNSYYDYTASTIETLGTANNDGTGNTYNIPFGQTVAKGTLNITTGVLSVTDNIVTLDSSVLWAKNSQTTSNAFVSRDQFPNYYRANGLCSHFQISRSSSDAEGIFFGDSINILTPLSLGLDTVQDFKNWFDAQAQNGTPVQVVYKLATPIEIQLSATQITALLNENNIWCDTNGNTTAKYILSVGEALRQG